jgi:hypothetical protein
MRHSRLQATLEWLVLTAIIVSTWVFVPIQG